jgi:hypothetical protein
MRENEQTIKRLLQISRNIRQYFCVLNRLSSSICFTSYVQSVVFQFNIFVGLKLRVLGSFR